MMTRSKFAAVALLAIVGAATPVFAGSSNDDQTTAAKLDEASAPQASPNSITLVAYADNPSQTGGGSDGYNSSTAHDYI